MTTGMMRQASVEFSSAPPDTAVGKALSVLASFDENHAEQSLAEIVAATSLPPATAHRYLAELVLWGGLERTSRGRYAVGRRLWQLGALAPRERHLRDIALPVLEDLFEATHEVVHLVVLDEDRALYIEKLMPRRSLTVSSQVGSRLPLHATGPGKVLLAYGSEELRRRVINGRLGKYASQTITDPRLLEQSLRTIRTDRFCISRNEMTEGNASAAAPVFADNGAVIAAISVVVSNDRHTMAGLVQAVRVAAAVISRSLRDDDRSAANTR